jgi:hypothetical protein
MLCKQSVKNLIAFIIGGCVAKTFSSLKKNAIFRPKSLKLVIITLTPGLDLIHLRPAFTFTLNGKI